MATTLTDAFVGIDVAFAKRKRLPVSVCKRQKTGIEVLSLRREFDEPPAGEGNVRALDEGVRKEFAEHVLHWLQRLEEAQNLTIRRIALDAPSDYCRDVSGRRLAENALSKKGISCFATPTEAQFRCKIEECRDFLSQGGKPSRLPNANQLWMLVGFQLFDTLRKQYPGCIETYPQAIVHQLNCADQHKSTESGLQCQIAAAAKVLDVSVTEMKNRLHGMGYGALHDRLDAFFSAWVASLKDEERTAFGKPPDDVIWVPRIKQVA